MKRLFSALAVVASAFGQDDVKRIATEDLKAMINEKTFFLDVRSAKEIQELGTLKGYVNIPLDEIEKRMSEIPKNKRIITA